ncbi:cytochrome P450 4F22 [Lingula anatina]|uniref:Cytochrome P450 4F22 n=1 Tax=Lingula anatina TaxID=7574 RepID=A0A1S3K1C1_LINAN|nr:cytochrome P450 4F22 [Lingula anatina]|eukprot:XP_013416433.1 cytochrome P450 4F22 [Lingula anatina]
MVIDALSSYLLLDMPWSINISTIFRTIFVLVLCFMVYKVYQFIAYVALQHRTLSQFDSYEDFHWWYGSLKGFKGVLNEDFMRGRLAKAEKNKYFFVQWNGPFFGALTLCHPDTAKVVLKGYEPKGRVYETLRPWLGDGLLLAKGKKWMRQRRLLTPAFHFDILRTYMVIYNEASDMFLTKLSGMAERNEPLDVFHHISLLTLDIILKCAFSFDANVQSTGKRHPYIQAVFDMCHDVPRRFTNPLFILYPKLYMLTSRGRRFQESCDIVHREANHVIAKRKKELEASGGLFLNKKRLDFLDILLTAKDSDGNGLSDEDIRAEVDTFLFEGHDTTASGLSWTIYLLANHPEHQQKCQEEIDEVMQGRDEIQWEDLPKLKYLGLCLKEAMRHYPPVAGISRKLEKDIEIMGKKVTAGTNVQLPIWILHHSSHVWGDDVMEFKPERFLPENFKNVNPFGYIPFSAGPRNCIGQNFANNEEKVVMARILHKFKISMADKSEKAEFNVALILKSAKEIKVALKPR